MKARQYLLIILAVFAIGYTTADRWSDAVELITPTIMESAIHIDTGYGSTLPPAHIELFCEFPMIAKASIALVTVFLASSFITFFFAARLNDYPQERFRPPLLSLA